ncbi:hypothetical protein LOTGIDRAFT_161737 [Lottia gigantea]|uniref:RING-type domain-containing protein n=1 Tax=Lottia gigantea TaxID=225164 RepID=V4BX37_LOTGI|nr:hypothetical protein LOTGIDRAFT_161737 [Lottia gigantea]ESO93624.1 hypothetical protein LOTGIDRAFT_161737 [Lottia gigantea]
MWTIEQKNMSARNPGNSNSSVILTAVALQDHWVRTLALGKTFGPRKIGIGPAAKSKQKKEIKSVVDTGNRVKKDNVKVKKEEEFVLDIKPPPLTLAQKFGLVDAPKQLLTEAEWNGVKIKSNIREDSKQPCVICKEDFGLQQQVLLSCSHVFHRACLQAFEKYTGKKTCPMCRHKQYQSRVIHEGSKQYRLTCATKIQAVWRGYVVRCWYKNFRLSVPPTDPKLRRKFFEEKLQDITDRMVKSCDFSLHGFLQEMDQSLEASRNVFKNFDAMFNILSEQDWEEVQLKAVLRADTDCPICLQDLAPTVLLSCSHVFHDMCLCTLEKLTEGDLRNNCPVCRAVYQKKIIHM